MAWNPQMEEKKVVIKVGDETAATMPATATAEEVRDKIIQIMREKGINRADVYVDGEYVTPEEFAEAYNNALEGTGDVEIKIVKVEKAA